jgi:hypothetical protein
MNTRRTITTPLYNIESPAVEGRLTILFHDSDVVYTQLVLINHGPKPVIYRYDKCYPFIIEDGKRPVRIMSLSCVVDPGQVYQHTIHGPNIFNELDNLEYLEWKYAKTL